MAPSPDELQELLNVCDKFATEHDIIYNVKKTKCMCIKPRRFKDLYIPNITLNGDVLNFVTCHKYLGYNIDVSFTDNKDISRQIRSIYAQGNIIVRKFKDCSPEVKSQLFKSYCNSFYCTIVWYDFKPTSLQNLNTAY